MKISGKGVVVLIVLLILIPFGVDTILSVALGGKKSGEMSMTRFSVNAYLKLLPLYIFYVIIAFAVMKLWKKWKNRER